MGAKHEQNHVGGRHFPGIDGEAAIVAGVVDDIVASGRFLDEKAVAIGGVGLVAIFGIGRDLHLWRVGFGAAQRLEHGIESQGAFPFNKLIDRSVDATVGFSGEKRFLAEIIFLPLPIGGIKSIAMGSVRHHPTVFKILCLLHSGRQEHIFLHIGFKRHPRHLFHNLVAELVGGVDVFVVTVAGLKIEVGECVHISHGIDVGGVKHKFAIAPWACIRNAGSVAQDVVEGDISEKGSLKFRKKFRQRVVEREFSLFGELQNCHC